MIIFVHHNINASSKIKIVLEESKLETGSPLKKLLSWSSLVMIGYEIGQTS
jgi:hypothetical protein